MNNELLKQISKPMFRAIIFLIASFVLCFYFAGRINKISNDIMEKRELLSLYQNSQEQYAVLKEDFSKISSHIDKVRGVFPQSENVLSFINAFENLAASNGIQQYFKFENVTPQPVFGLNLFQIPFNVTLSGTKAQFLNYLAGLERLPYFTKIDFLNMTTVQDFESQAQIIIRGILYVR